MDRVDSVQILFLIQKLFIYHNSEPLFPFFEGRISNFLCIFSVVIAVILCLILRCYIGSFIKTQA